MILRRISGPEGGFLFFRDRKNQRSRRFDAAAADQGSTGPLDPPCRCVGGDFRPLPRRPTLDGPAPEVLLHCLYAGDRETPHLAPPPTLPKLAIGLSGAPHAAGHPAPSPAAHVEFFFIGLAGLPAPLTRRETSHPPAPLRCIRLIVFPRHWIFVQNFWGGGGENEGETGRKILRGFQQSFQGPRFYSLGR